jgi:methyltransferase-like protein 23
VLASAAQSPRWSHSGWKQQGRESGNVTLASFDDLTLDAVSIPIGGREWRVECVTDQGRVLAYAESHPQAPYGLLLWESAVALARSLHHRSTLVANKQVLELGAGVGLPGLVARSLGAEVWQTDHLTDALEIARLNARVNDVGGIRHFAADWTRWTDDRLYDVILGADILYERGMQTSVVSIFRRNLAPGGFVLLADPGRQQSFDLLARLEDEGARFDLEIAYVEPTCDLGDGDLVEVALLKGEFGAYQDANSR